MEQVKVWASILCAAAVAAGMAGILTPSGGMEKIYKFVVSVFFLACVLVPLFSLKNIRLPAAAGTFVSETGAPGQFGSVVESQQQQAVRRQLEQMVAACCKQSAGASPRAVEVDLQTESGAYQAKAIRVTLDDGDWAKRDRVAQACKSQLGLDVTVLRAGSVS